MDARQKNIGLHSAEGVPGARCVKGDGAEEAAAFGPLVHHKCCWKIFKMLVARRGGHKLCANTFGLFLQSKL
jgi:hypothetical protein